MLPIIGAALPFLISGASSLANNIFGGLAARRERKFAQQNWQKQNEYNAPAAVMARYRAAGMNPSYAGQMSFANSSPPPDSANKTHAVEVPNQLDTLKEYFSLKNAELENSRLQETIAQQKMQNQFLPKFLEERNRYSEISGDKAFSESNRLARLSQWEEEIKKYDGYNPVKLDYETKLGRYQLESARAGREAELFGITKQIANLDLDWKKLGVNPNDNIFVRLLTRLFDDKLKGGLMNYFK